MIFCGVTRMGIKSPDLSSILKSSMLIPKKSRLHISSEASLKVSLNGKLERLFFNHLSIRESLDYRYLSVNQYYNTT